MTGFFDMGGYAFFVWGSYGAAVLVFAWNVFAPRRERARLRAALRDEGQS